MCFHVARLILIGVITSLTACASFKYIMDTPDSQLTFRHTTLEFKVAWNTIQTGNDMVIEGLITNVRNIQVKSVEMNVMVLDANERHLSEGTVLLDHINGTVPFSVKIKDGVIAKGSVLKFIVSYHINDGSWYGRSGQSSFKVDAVTGVAIEEQKVK